MRTSGSSRRLEQALDYVGQRWFPVNQKIFDEILSKLNTNAYLGSIELLLNDLKSDFALYAYCLKKIKELEKNTTTSIVNNFYSCQFDELKDIVSNSRSMLSKHDLSAAERSQALRLKFTVLSCSAAELMARAAKTDTDLAFVCALSRQVGLNLIAWNYPSIYSRAITLVRSANQTLEEILAENLGFSPQELASHLIIPANTNSDIRKACGLNGAIEGAVSSQSSKAIVDDSQLSGIVDICEISDAFAQLHDPEHHPNISRRYETVIAQVTEYLGPNGSNAIVGFANDRFKKYVTCIPEVFRADTSLEVTMAKVAGEYTNALFDRNVYAQRCPENFKKALKEVYKHVSKDHVSSLGIGYLVNKVIPMSGFGKGCVYLLDNKRTMLVPRLRIGPCTIERYKAINCALVNPEGSLIVEALYCTMPIKQENVILHDEQVSPILAPIGTKEPMGVLYLEMTDSLKSQQSHDVITIFKAIRDCFNDCLNV